MSLSKKERDAQFEDGETAVRINVYRVTPEGRDDKLITSLRATVVTVGTWHAVCAQIAKRISGVNHSDVHARLLKLKPGKSFTTSVLTIDYRYERAS